MLDAMTADIAEVSNAIEAAIRPYEAQVNQLDEVTGIGVTSSGRRRARPAVGSSRWTGTPSRHSAPTPTGNASNASPPAATFNRSNSSTDEIGKAHCHDDGLRSAQPLMWSSHLALK